MPQVNIQTRCVPGATRQAIPTKFRREIQSTVINSPIRLGTVSQSPVAALWRLRPYLRPYRRQLIAMLSLAITTEAMEIVIPLLAVCLGAMSAALSLIRRWIQGNAVSSMEKTLRYDLYAHLERLEPAFHDEWQSGQLLSRATTDLSAIRRFAGFGLIFLVTNIMTFVAVVALLIHLNWWLGLVTGVVFAPVLPVCFRFG